MRKLTDKQKGELDWWKEHVQRLKAKIDPFGAGIDFDHIYNQGSERYKWSLPWLNEKTVGANTVVICIGGAILDDLPHVSSNYKLNIDYLANQYFKILPSMLEANVKHVCGTIEDLPLPSACADFVYSRNSIDHVDNPERSCIEMHRILKSSGLLLLSAMYNSKYHSLEPWSVNDDFIEKYIEPLFSITHTSFLKIKEVKWINLVGGKK